MNYYISDLHLFHEASIKYDNRPFSTLKEMHSAGMKKECRHAIGQDVKAYNVGCMKRAINYTPRTLKEIMDRNEETLPE